MVSQESEPSVAIASNGGGCNIEYIRDVGSGDRAIHQLQQNLGQIFTEQFM